MVRSSALIAICVRYHRIGNPVVDPEKGAFIS